MTPTPQPLPLRSVTGQTDASHTDSHILQPPSRLGRDGRSFSPASAIPNSRAQSFASNQPGSFSSDLKSSTYRSEYNRSELGHYMVYDDEDTQTTSEQRQAEIRDKIDKEIKIKIGSENLLEALNSKNAKQSKDQKLRVEAELNSSNRKLAQLYLGLEQEIQRSKEQPAPAPIHRYSNSFHDVSKRPPSRQEPENNEEEAETESPTFVLAELLQALEAEGMQPEYYVQRSNSFVDLFKRCPTLKYDLAWSIFGLRVQTLLLSGSREVVAAGYRMMRHAITDRKSLQTIRNLNTDYLVILSLVKDSKANLEREQALKFVRGFLDVKDGVKEISQPVIRVIVSVAEHNDDRLKSIAILTLAEILVRDPPRIVSAGGIGTLTDALGDGNYSGSESLTGAFLYLLDVPWRRKYLRSGHEIESPFATFTDIAAEHAHNFEDKLKTNAKVIATLLKSWPGLMTLSSNNFLAIKSLIAAIYTPNASIRNVIFELLFDVLRIKPPSWSSSFLAGRRLTTYGRVTNMKSSGPKGPGSKNSGPKNSVTTENDDQTNYWSLVDHYVAIVLATLLRSGLVPALLFAEEDSLNLALKRKTTLLLGEVLKMASDLLPSSWSADLQVLPDLLKSAAKFGIEDRFIATGTIYQVDSVNRTLYRSGASTFNVKGGHGTESELTQRQQESSINQANVQIDESQFRTMVIDSQILNTVNFTKWNWGLIQNIIDGPLLNPKRLDEAIKSTKFVHRLLGFYRPFKRRFCDIKNTKPNQRYVRAGAALVRTLLQNPEGVKYLAESKLIRQLAECLSHFDRMSGLTSEWPLFSTDRMTETLTGGYFTILGALSKDPKGLAILERWRIVNMFYHIVELRYRDDLVIALLSNMDFTIDGHLRIILSKAMTSCSKDIRIFSTRLLRRYATQPMQTSDSAASTCGTAEWAIRLLVTQIYDPEVEVCEVAIKILEEACNQTRSLEYVVKCRPALDHLGEIGAPLLLRFLSTSVGYHYLDGVDYITKEMDDWFLGRNDTYVSLIEASLARALADIPEKPQQILHAFDETPDHQDYGLVPPHFYRELTRTKEGCKLLEQKGHFDEFVATIKDWGLEDDDPETILKVKGCLWAVGNVGSMELGAPFLEKSDVVKDVVSIAEKSEVMSLRGTAFFVLGLISRSLHGQELLIEYGWDGSVNDLGESLGFCIPLNFNKLFSIKPWTRPLRKSEVTEQQPELKVIKDNDDPIDARILKSTIDLGNTVLAKKAGNDLRNIKSKKPAAFQNPQLFKRVVAVLSSHQFQLPVCHFIINLFDKELLRQIVLEDDDTFSVAPETIHN